MKKKAKQHPERNPARLGNPNRFRRTEAKRLVQATLDAGLSVKRVEVDPASGKISVIPGNADDAVAESLTADDELERWQRKRDANQSKRFALDASKVS